ncbi:hypothetical protein MMC07_009008 [Pseudocyphellaria aurata]|nr:hypothetical protein [Pseudocyphellaria aurata]
MPPSTKNSKRRARSLTVDQVTNDQGSSRRQISVSSGTGEDISSNLEPEHDAFGTSEHDAFGASEDEDNASGVSEHDAFGASEHDASGASEHNASSVSEHNASGASEHDASGASEHDASSVSEHNVSGASEHNASGVSEHNTPGASEHDAFAHSESRSSASQESLIRWTSDPKMATNDGTIKRNRKTEALTWLQENPSEQFATAVRIFKYSDAFLCQPWNRTKNPNQNKLGEINVHGGHNKVLSNA